MKELKVQPIRNGTVIDHIPPGKALAVLRVLGLPHPETTSTMTIAMNVPSGELKGRKDVLKIEDRELDPSELAKVALIAPRATVNIVREFEIAKKSRAELPEKITGIVKCSNLNCITNFEPIKPGYYVLSADPVRLKCMYCDREIENVVAQIR